MNFAVHIYILLAHIFTIPCKLISAETLHGTSTQFLTEWIDLINLDNIIIIQDLESKSKKNHYLIYNYWFFGPEHGNEMHKFVKSLHIKNRLVRVVNYSTRWANIVMTLNLIHLNFKHILSEYQMKQYNYSKAFLYILPL